MNYRSSTGRKRVPLVPSEAPMEEQRLVFAGTGRSRGLEGRLRALSENGYPPIPSGCEYTTYPIIWLVVEPYPSEKYEFVSWDDHIPNWMEQ